MLFINRFGIGSRLTQSWAKIEMPGLAELELAEQGPEFMGVLL